MSSSDLNDDLNACAEIVYKADPDRFRATMAAPIELREKLLPLYAFNIEVARAPWVTGEVMIAEMRLQWWHDALGEVIAGGFVRRHEVVTPLAVLLSPEQAVRLQSLVEARRWDIYSDSFPDSDALWAHLQSTTGSLLGVALEQAGQVSTPAALDYAAAVGLAGWLTAVPALKSAGRSPLPSEAAADIADLAASGLAKLASYRKSNPAKAARTVLLAGWQAEPTLRRAASAPERVLAGTLPISAARSRARLARKAILKTL